MLLESKEQYLCDCCGTELEEASEFKIVLDYGSTDACFQGSGIKELEKEPDLNEDNADVLQQPDYHFCEECESDTKTYFRKFEVQARSTRTAILLKMQENEQE